MNRPQTETPPKAAKSNPQIWAPREYSNDAHEKQMTTINARTQSGLNIGCEKSNMFI